MSNDEYNARTIADSSLVIGHCRDGMGLYECDNGTWTQRAFTRQKGTRGIARLLRIAAALCVALALAGVPSAIAETPLAADPALWRFEVTTTWTGDGAEDNPNRPLVGDDYAVDKWEDVTGQPSENLHPDPNLYNVQAEATEAVLDAIEADNDYLVVWSEEIAEGEDWAQIAQNLDTLLADSDSPEDVRARKAAQAILAQGTKKEGKDKDGEPPPNEFGQIRSFLARNGVSQAEITAVIGTGSQGRTRSEIAGLLREWMKEFPKGAQG